MKSTTSSNAGRAALSRSATAQRVGAGAAFDCASVAATMAAMARAVAPPSRTVLRPTRSLAWIAVVPS